MNNTAEKDEVFAAPIELEACDIKNISDGKIVGKFTRVLLKSEEYGVLTPEKYRAVTNRNKTSTQLFTWAMRQISLVFAKSVLQNGIFVSLYLPYKLLGEKSLDKLLSDLKKKSGFPTEKIVFELSSEVLYEDEKSVVALINQYKEEYGIKFMLGEYGNEFCPALRVGLFNFDYVLTDSTICNREQLSSSEVISAATIAKSSGAAVILGCSGRGMKEAAEKSGFDMYISGSKALPDGRLA